MCPWAGRRCLCTGSARVRPPAGHDHRPGLQEELDYDAIQKAGIDIARPVGVITWGDRRGAQPPPSRRAVGHEQAQGAPAHRWEAQQAGRDVQTRMAESAPPAKEADELGMDLRLVAANNLDAGKPQRAEMPGPEQAQAGQAGTAARAPWSPVEPARRQKPLRCRL